MAVSDPLVAGWVDANAPALTVFAPALGAAFIWFAGQGAERRSPRRAIEPARALFTAPPPRLSVATAPLTMASFEAPEPAPRNEIQPLAPVEPPLTRAPAGWNEERVVVVGFVILAALAGIIIFVASFLDSLT
jgi:hypothetical protein